MFHQYLKIGDMAKMNHTTVPTLRLYDRIGLLTPSHVDADTGYRYYDVKQNARFDMIQYMQELGMQLREIKKVLDREDLDFVESVLIQKEKKTAEEIEQLTIQQDAIRQAVRNIERYKKSPKSGAFTLEYISQRSIYAINTDVNFYDHDLDTYELILKQLKSDLIANHLASVYYCNAGTIMPKENFEKLDFISNRIFVFADSHFPSSDTQYLPEGMYACIYCDSFSSEKQYAEELKKICEQKGYCIAGDYICEVLIEFNVFHTEERSMFLRLQVPVSFSK